MDCASQLFSNDRVRLEALRQLQVVADGDDDTRVPSLEALALVALAVLDGEEPVDADEGCVGID